jgi:YfiH family protein
MASGEGLLADWIAPDWAVADRVGAVFTTRHGGVSSAPFDSFNLGTHVGDEACAVSANRLRLAEVIGRRPVFLNQVHGRAVAKLDIGSSDGSQADACVSNVPGVACVVMVADCLPILLADRQGRAVAAVHAGWRGLAGGVIEAAVCSLGQSVADAAGLEKTSPAEMVAWLGPCIGPDAFEVGEDVRRAFAGQDGAGRAAFRPQGQGKYLAHLSFLARQRLLALGVAEVTGNDGSDPWCTVRQSSRFFSHRRDTRVLGATGRMAACVWLR